MGRMVEARKTLRFTVISTRVPSGIVEAIDLLIEQGMFQNRSDAFREALRRLVIDYMHKQAAAKLQAVTTIR